MYQDSSKVFWPLCPCPRPPSFPGLIPVLGSLKQSFSGVNPESPGQPEASLLLWGEGEEGLLQRWVCLTLTHPLPQAPRCRCLELPYCRGVGTSVVNLFDHPTEARQTRTFILHLSRNVFGWVCEHQRNCQLIIFLPLSPLSGPRSPQEAKTTTCWCFPGFS